MANQKFHSHENNVIRDLYTKNPNRFEKQHQEKMQLKPIRYGFIHVNRQHKKADICNFCNNEINGVDHLIIWGTHYHGKCFNEKNKQSI